MEESDTVTRTSEKLYSLLQEKLLGWTVSMLEENKIVVESVNIQVEADNKNDNQKTVVVSWTNQDEDLGAYTLGLLQNMG